TTWRNVLRDMKLPAVSFHALRHTHASALIAAGLDVVQVSKRLGHSNPTTTLRIYSHLFKQDDSAAAKAMDAGLRIAPVPIRCQFHICSLACGAENLEKAAPDRWPSGLRQRS